jgi:hypothetical protein
LELHRRTSPGFLFASCKEYCDKKYLSSIYVLAGVLCELDQKSPAPLSESKNPFVACAIRLFEGTPWYFNLFPEETGEEVPSKLFLEQQADDRLKKLNPLNNLFQQSQLFKILDETERNRRLTKFSHLTEYNVFLGDLDDHLEFHQDSSALTQAPQVLPSLMDQDEDLISAFEQDQKKSKKQPQKRGPQQSSKPLNSRHNLSEKTASPKRETANLASS